MILENSIRFTWSPFFWRNFNKKEHKLIFNQVFRLLVIGLGVCMILYSLFIQDLFMLFINKEYWSGLNLLVPFGFGYALNILIPLVSMGAHIVKKTIYNSIIQLISTVIYFTLLLILIPEFQLLGVAYSFFISRISLIIMFWMLHNWLYPMNYSAFLLAITMAIVMMVALSLSLYNYSIEIKIGLAFVPLIIGVYTALKSRKKPIF